MDIKQIKQKPFFSKLTSPTLKNLAGYMSLTYSITGLLIILGLAGKHQLASDVAIVQGAVLATFYVLSGDARHLILTDQSSANQVIFFRLVWFLPLAIISYYISTVTGHIDSTILSALILRRSAEWLAEIHVTEIERVNGIWKGWILQPIIFILLICQILFTNNLWLAWIWAVSPIIFSLKFIYNAQPHNFINLNWESLTSTAIIGFTGYIQRVLIVALTGKELSGMLFPGFAIGSFVGSMAANVAGPTLFRKGLLHTTYFTNGLIILFITGAIVFCISDTVLYQTVGLSVIGGAFMISAQESRLSHLKDKHTLELDLLFQLSLIFSIVVIYYIDIAQGMMGFYLIGSALACIFYKGNQMIMKLNINWKRKFSILISLGLVIPIFFQVSGHVYNNQLVAMVDSGGNIKSLPLPLSLLFCYLGVIFFRVGYDKIKPVILTISLTFLFLIASTMIVHEGLAKLILLVQFMLPTVALLLGVAFANEDRKLFAKVSIYFLTIFVPSQLIMTWVQGQLALTHYMYLFSVYSHYQYVPLMIVAIFAWSWVELRDSHTKWVYLFSPWIGMYVAAGNSTLALFGLIIFSCFFAYFSRKRKLDFLIPILIVSAIGGYFYANSKLGPEINKRINGSWVCQSGAFVDGLNGPCKPGVFLGKLFDIKGHWLYSNDAPRGNDNQIKPVNLIERQNIASIYVRDIVDHPLTIIYGHSSPPLRSQVSSAHNYYLDLVYNFGVFSCLPLLALLFYTIIRVYQQKKYDPTLIWLLFIILYIVTIDNNFKVSLRQPYPGILTFFLWGSLLGLLNSKINQNSTNTIKLFPFNKSSQ